MTDLYSPAWYHFFLDSVPQAQTAHEIDFLARQLPNPPYQALLDVCCGSGRHAQPLAERGYQVTGIDLNPDALANAEANAWARAGRNSNDNPLGMPLGMPPGMPFGMPPGMPFGMPHYLHHDMRQIAHLPGAFDAILCLWQSFGYFSEAVNQDILRQMRAKLNPRGRLILDIYHRGFFEQHTGQRRFERNGYRITETKTLTGHRLRVQLDYGMGHAADIFEWQLYTPDEICELAGPVGLTPRLTCSGFDPANPASADQARMQIVFETTAG